MLAAWPLQVGASPDTVEDIVTLGDGSALVAGYRDGTRTFGGTTLTGPGALVAKLNSDGSYAWAAGSAETGNNTYTYAVGITAFPDGSSLVVGRFQHTVAFGGITLVSSGAYDIFIAKVTSDGAFAWAKRVGGAHFIDNRDQVFSVCVLTDGSALVSGKAEDADFDTISLPGDVPFLAKLNVDGSFAWAKAVPGRFSDIAALPGASALVTGSFTGSQTFGATTLTNTGGSDVVVAKVNPDGSFAWANRAGWTDDDKATSIAALPDGSAVVVGTFSAVAVFGGTTLTSTSVVDVEVFVAKVSATGSFVWANKAGSTITDSVEDVCVAPDGTAFMTGWFQSTASFGASSLTAEGFDIFTARVNSDGGFAWARRVGGADYDSGNAIARRPDGAILVAGRCGVAAMVGGTKLTGGGGLVAKVSPDGVIESAPGAPTNVKGTAGFGEVNLSWTAPAQLNGLPITGYGIAYRSTNQRIPTWTYLKPDANASSTATTRKITGLLTDGTRYLFRVKAINASGGGLFSTDSAPVYANNKAPTALALSSTTVLEKQPAGTVVGTLSTTDPDAGNTFKYAIVQDPNLDGTGVFEVVGNQLRTKQSFTFATKSSYSVRIRSTDQGGLFVGKLFTITVAKLG